MESGERRAVLILGAGINGCAVARELVLNNIPVWVVDNHDIAFGATSRSSRLIHGGLRYLEYGDFGLVRESLEERSRLRKLAPQFVEPLRLYIPVRRRAAGIPRALFQFLGGSRSRLFGRMSRLFPGTATRGLWLVRLGLWMYDVMAKSDDFPKHSVSTPGAESAPSVDPAKYRWLCAYTDARMRFPERFVIALLEDARQLAQQNGVDFRVFTYHRAQLAGHRAVIRRVFDGRRAADLEPSAVINATGAWGDLTLEQLEVPSRRLFGGTKGSHFISYHRGLREALGANGVYAEAADGRLVFVLPFGEGVLVGTTDEPFEDRPDRAVATKTELDYLIGMVNQLFPAVNLIDDDVDAHYSGVRPLPYSASGQTAAIPRGHWIVRHENTDKPVFTLVGGKLTTCRILAEQVADEVCKCLGVQRTRDSRDRPVPGGRNYPSSGRSLRTACDRLAARFGLNVAQIRAMWELCGNRVETILSATPKLTGHNLAGTQLPMAFVRWIIHHEWTTTLDDLIERRLMLLYQPQLHERCLAQLAACLVEAQRLEPSEVESAVEASINRLRQLHGKTVVRESTKSPPEANSRLASS